MDWFPGKQLRHPCQNIIDSYVGHISLAKSVWNIG